MTIGKKILVTGATGFVGSCLAHSLAESGEDLHLLVRKDSDLWRIKDITEKVRLHEADISDRENLEKVIGKIKPEVIFHLATYGAYAIQKDPVLTVAANVHGTINLVYACSRSGFSHFINVGSSSEYGIKNKAMKETDILEPNSIYGVTKATGTLYCQHMARENHLPITTFRIFAAYGYYEERMRLVSSLILSCLKKENPKLSSPDSVRDFIFTQDVCDALLKAVDRKEAIGEIFNLGTGVQHTIREVAESVVDLTEADVKLEWGTKQKMQPEPKNWCADMSKTIELLGWKPRYNLRNGLRKDIEWFGDHSALYERKGSENGGKRSA